MARKIKLASLAEHYWGFSFYFGRFVFVLSWFEYCCIYFYLLLLHLFHFLFFGAGWGAGINCLIYIYIKPKVRLALVLKTFFISVSFHILVASLTLMALF